MKRLIGCLLIFLISASSFLFADIDKLRIFQKNFLRASLSTKIQVLQDASDETDVDMGPLYLQALDFSIKNTAFLGDDPIARELSILAVRLVSVAGYREALMPLWDLFTLDLNRSVRIEALSAIAGLTPPEPAVVAELNRWITDQNEAFKNSESVDFIVLSEAALTLGILGDERSFSVLFSMSTTGYPEMVANKARTALYKIEGDFTELIVQVLRQNPVAEKLQAFRLANENSDLSADMKAKIAEIALSQALASEYRNPVDRGSQRQLRYESVRVLSDYGWATATTNVITHFNLLVEEFSAGIGEISNIIEAIDALGAMGTHEAAERLALYLDVLNSDVETGKAVSDQIALAVITNLGALEDLVAFETLLFVGYLEYSEQVKNAATDAIDKL